MHTETFPWRGAAFNGIDAASPHDIWAVGSNIAMRWDGHRWRRTQLPSDQKYGELADVAAVAADDVWAVGRGGVGNRPLVMHWNGKRWRTLDMRGVAPHGSDLWAIEAASAHDVWAVGGQNLNAPSSAGYGDLVLRWDGRRWREVPSPLTDEFGEATADSVSISPSGEVWTANGARTDNGPHFVRWSGPARRITHLSSWDIDPILQSVHDIAAVSKTRVWAVGAIDYDEHGKDTNTPLVGYWNGLSWHLQHTPFEALRRAPLYAISAISATEVWVVGNHLIARYSC